MVEVSPEEQTTPLDCAASCRGDNDKASHSALIVNTNDGYEGNKECEGSDLLAEVANAPDLEGARGLTVLHLQVHRGSHMFGHADALQERRVYMEVLRHGALDCATISRNIMNNGRFYLKSVSFQRFHLLHCYSICYYMP